MIKSEKIIICGPSGVGKDFLLRGLVKKDLRYQPKITTRPKRSLEQEGIEYNFMDNEKFDSLLESSQIKVYQYFLINENDWYYAISNQNFEDNQVFIMTPHEISCLSAEDRKKCFVVYLDMDEDVRRNRIANRDDNNDSIERRIKSDKEDFKNFVDYDLKISDPEFDIDMVYELMN